MAAAALLALGGCTVGPDYHAPTPWYSPASWFGGRPKITPAADLASTPSDQPPDPDWWTIFRDPELTSLERRVAAANLDVRVAGIRLAESRAQLGIARAGEFPTLGANGSYAREKVSKEGVISLFGAGPSSSSASQANGLSGTQTGIPNTALTAPFDLYQAGFDASWELDLWGQIRRQVESAKAQVTASAEARRDTLVTALAELARDYVQLRGTQSVIQITQGNLDSQRHGLQLVQERAAAGLGSDLDVANQAAQVQSTASQIPTLQAQAQQYINAIALLLGEPPNRLDAELDTPAPLPPVPPSVPAGVPSDLARRRPDIRHAEAALHAATADVGVAVASFYPTVTLSGSAALQSLQFTQLFGWPAGTYSIGPSITLPIFQGGQLTRTLELRKAQQQEAAIAYQQTVLNALHDVNNALINYDAQQGQEAALARAVQQSRRALDLAQEQYSGGLVDFLNVITAQQQVLSTEQQLAQANAAVSTDLVALYKALGGGWQQSFPEEATRAAPGPLIPAQLVEP